MGVRFVTESLYRSGLKTFGNVFFVAAYGTAAYINRTWQVPKTEARKLLGWKEYKKYLPDDKVKFCNSTNKWHDCFIPIFSTIFFKEFYRHGYLRTIFRGSIYGSIFTVPFVILNHFRLLPWQIYRKTEVESDYLLR